MTVMQSYGELLGNRVSNSNHRFVRECAVHGFLILLLMLLAATDRGLQLIFYVHLIALMSIVLHISIRLGAASARMYFPSKLIDVNHTKEGT